MLNFFLDDSDTMRAPSLLAQCLPGLVPCDKGSQNLTPIAERDAHLPLPAVEILPSTSKVSLQSVLTLVLNFLSEVSLSRPMLISSLCC